VNEPALDGQVRSDRPSRLPCISSDIQHDEKFRWTTKATLLNVENQFLVSDSLTDFQIGCIQSHAEDVCGKKSCFRYRQSTRLGRHEDFADKVEEFTQPVGVQVVIPGKNQTPPSHFSYWGN
jgi:hypothetical protein